jgi:hypothetical protein
MALALAEAQGSAELLVMAHQNVAEPEFYQGKFASSLTHCERALALYDPARHSEFLLGSHTGIPALGYAAWNLWCLGSPDSALARAEEAVSLGRRLNHPFSLARALFFETAIHGTDATARASRNERPRSLRSVRSRSSPCFSAPAATGWWRAMSPDCAKPPAECEEEGLMLGAERARP